jgi:hypothetical protein
MEASSSPESAKRTVAAMSELLLLEAAALEEPSNVVALLVAKRLSTPETSCTSLSSLALSTSTPPFDQVVLDSPQCNPVLHNSDDDQSDDSSVSDISFATAAEEVAASSESVGGSSVGNNTPRSIFKSYWEKNRSSECGVTPTLVRASLSSPSSFHSLSSAQISCALVRHEHSLNAADEQRLSLLQRRDQDPPSPASASPSPRRSIFGGLTEKPLPLLPSLKAPILEQQAQDPAWKLEGSLDGGCFSIFPRVMISPQQFLPPLKFRKTRSDSALEGSLLASIGGSRSKEKMTRSCLRRGRFSSGSLSNVKAQQGCDCPGESPRSPAQTRDHEQHPDHQSDAGSVTFNEDGNRIVVFDLPKELWSQRGWADYFAC